MSNWDWRWAFYLQSILYIPVSACYFIYPQKYFKKHKNRNMNNAIDQRLSVNFSFDHDGYTRYEGETGIPRQALSNSIKEYTQCEGLKKLFKNGIYLLLTLSTSCLYFVITGLQFWITDYMIIVIKVSETQAFISYAVLCVTAPTFGVLIGGIAIHNMGGYDAPGVLGLVSILQFLAIIIGAPIPFITSFVFLLILLWLLLFLGGFMMPALTGMIISSVPTNLKETASSVAYICYNCLGYLPSPFLYGIVSNLGKGSESNYGMILLISWIVIGNIFIQFALFFKTRKIQKNSSKIFNI